MQDAETLSGELEAAEQELLRRRELHPRLGLPRGHFQRYAIDMRPIVDAISRVTSPLKQMELPSDAPPVFLLDSMRLAGARPVEKGTFDNRWIIVPQDLPRKLPVAGKEE